jgi:PPIC-type PPIASE domain
MVKVRLVALGTFAAVSALAFGLSTLKNRPISIPPASASASASASQVVESAPAPASSVVEKEAIPSNVVPGLGKDYATMPDGTPVPELPATAPRNCGFGAILFTYEGAQFAPRQARSKAEAHRLAKDVLAKADQNFVDAVKLGDPGSLADAGSIGRGILERSIEYRLFTLEKGRVFPEPVETPRGYWVMKRLR